jgi:hypothetical protein
MLASDTVANKRNRGTVGTEKCADFVTHTLWEIPSVFGRLAYLAALRDPENDRYRDHILARAFGPEQAHRALKHTHQEVFRQWLCFGLEQQKADVARYLSAGKLAERAILDVWTEMTLYHSLVPLGVMDPERELFLSNLGIVLTLIGAER